MYNIFTYNEKVFNVQSTSLQDTINEDIAYNKFWLKNNLYSISKISFDNSHEIQSETFDRPLSDWWSEINYFFRNKTVDISGRIRTNTAEELNNEIDRFKKAMLENNKNLDIKVNGQVRRAKASCINPSSLFNREHYHITFLPFTISFRVLEKFREIKPQTYTFTWLTWNFLEEVYNGGTAKVSPVFTIIINTATETDTASIILWGETITVDQTLVSGDILTIDYEEKIVTLNQADIDYTGTFGLLDTGEKNFSVEINWTINFDFTVKFFNTYL